ncbi:MAG: penicillin-binding protein 2 [Patescibacteria group bacterium]
MRNFRINIILLAFFLFAAAIISRLFFLQIINHKFYQAQALGQQAGFKEAQGSRGEIYSFDSQKNKGSGVSSEVKSLAINQNGWTATATLKEIDDKNNFAELLSKEIGEPKESILSKIEREVSYTIIKKGLSEEQAQKIKALNLKGLYWQNIPVRYYPQEGLASQVIGFASSEGKGQYGIEGYYDDILKGKSGIKEEKKGLDAIFSNDGQISLDGSNLYLTIDYNIQFEAESLLKEAQNKLSMESGQIIVIKPDSGRILAIVNFPAFNLNQYSKEKDFEIFQNSVVQKLFEPGSIMKPFTMAIALNEGKVNPETTFTDKGFVKIGHNVIWNFGHAVYGKQTMAGVLEKSINTGAVFVSQQVSRDTYLEYMNKFGFSERTGIDLQGEVYSRNDALKNGRDIEFATASFGQGIDLTPIQIVRGFGAIANGGRLVKPYVVEKITRDSSEVLTNPQFSEQIISQQTASQVTAMMINVVEKGFGSEAKISGYYIAGKTGTAEIPFRDKKGYYPDKTIQSFVGFAPALNPQFLILVKLDNPKVPKSSLSAAPIFKDLAQYIINYWQIPPDYDANLKK